jgi:hypothetical protein
MRRSHSCSARHIIGSIEIIAASLLNANARCSVVALQNFLRRLSGITLGNQLVFG